MSNQKPEIITKYEVLFAVRTGMTIMMPKVTAFDGNGQRPPGFTISPENARDIIIRTGHGALLLKGLQKEHLEAALARGFIMFYETEDDEIVRNTICHYQKN